MIHCDDEHIQDRSPPFAQQMPPILTAREDGPEVRGPAALRVPQPGADRQDGSDQRLQHEAEGHRAADAAAEVFENPRQQVFQLFSPHVAHADVAIAPKQSSRRRRAHRLL